MSSAAKKKAEIDEAVGDAAVLLKIAKKGGGMTAHSALRLVGVSTKDRQNKALQKRVHRARDKLHDQQKKLTTEFDQMELAEEDHPFPSSQESVIPIVPRLPKQLNMRKTSKQAAAQRKANVQVKDLKGKLFMEACEAVKEENEKEQ
ncbi:unknown protein [Seminavis robusta]|uniref:Uncharacterized protein n=1 Tax=Seminavis robusta TaxID=568900 RepID=A0A9N8DR55_9STRA|nr:unknown protein [Seminavis robusta]|eukprot:Sro292_g109600.1 n/a (147) ;mRNA; f:26387-26827